MGTDTKLAQRVASIESSIDTMIERMGERIELAIERALKNYTHRDDHSGLAERVDEIDRWRAAMTAAHAVETKHADLGKANLNQWLQTLTPYFFGALGFIYLSIKAVAP